MLVALLCVVAVVVTPVLAINEAVASICFMSCGRPAGAPPEADHGVSAAFIVGTAVPVVGIALSIYTNQIAARVLFGLVLGLTLFIGFLASADDARDRTPPPRPRVTRCQEYSGGDTTCPGG